MRPKDSKQGLSVHGVRKIHSLGDTPITPIFRKDENNLEKEKKVRIVMDVDESIKAKIEENAKMCGMSMTLYLVWCALHEEPPKALPPSEIVKVKNLLCNFQEKLFDLEYMVEDNSYFEPYIKECKKLMTQIDRLLLEAS